MPQAPQVPTIAESGAAFAGYECSSDFALLAPAGTPAPVVARLHAAMAAAMRNPEVIERMGNAAMVIDVGTAEAWPAQIAAESRKWGDLIRDRGIKLD